MRIVTVALAAILIAVTADRASAQEAASPGGSSQGPLVLEPIHSPFVVTPEYKVTDLDNRTGQLAGATVGWLMDQRLLIGGAVYKLVNSLEGRDLTYGGLVIGWSTPQESRVRFGARGLVGGGSATLPVTATSLVRFGGRRGPDLPVARSGDSIVVRFLGRDDFFVFEPQANAGIQITQHIGIDGVVGYRLTGDHDFSRDRLDGVTGGIALQFGW